MTQIVTTLLDSETVYDISSNPTVRSAERVSRVMKHRTKEKEGSQIEVHCCMLICRDIG